MRPFEQLSHRGQIQRLKHLALAALEQYPFYPTRLRLLQGERNAVFRVDTTDGNKFVIHVADPVFTVEETRSALQWLDAIAQDGTISVPQPIRNNEGTLLTLQTHEGVPEARICTVISWVNGVELGYKMSHTDIYEWARVVAQVHAHGRSYQPPKTFSRMTYDDVLAFPTDELVIFDDAWRPLLATDRRRTIYRRALEQSNAAIKALYANDTSPQILHGDLNVWNVLRYYSTYSLIDFEDVMWGFPVQDVGTALYYARYAPDYAALCKTFKAGYTSVADAWVESEAGQLDSMIVARYLNLYNMRLQYDNPQNYNDYEALTAEGEAMLGRYLETGSIAG